MVEKPVELDGKAAQGVPLNLPLHDWLGGSECSVGRLFAGMSKAVRFSFEKVYEDSFKVSCAESLDIPLCQSPSWLLSRLILDHNIPEFAEKDFSDALLKFIKESEKSFVDDRLTRLYDGIRLDENRPVQIAASLERRVKERISTRFQTEPPTDEEIFGQTYSKIVQSPAAMDLIQLEHSFAVAVETEIVERNRALNSLQKSIVDSTEALLSKNSEEISVTDAVSELQRRFHSEYEIQKMTWNSRISDLKETQRQDYRNFVMSIEEQMLQADLSKPLPPKPSDIGGTSSTQTTPLVAVKNSGVAGPRSESFMVQLGRQLRSFYNLKLIEADPIDLMTPIGSTGTSDSSPSVEATVNLAERLSSALTIYSNELTGLVILVDSQMFQSRAQQRLAEVCELSTDFHFPELDRQLADVQEIVKNFPEVTPSSAGKTMKGRPKPGDVYLTRHSNLRASEIGGNAGGGGGVEVVFNVVTEGDAMGGNAVSPSLSAHLHVAISTVLRVCNQYDISTLSLPLLFTRRPLENLPLTWCQRRAEAVLKVVKGTLMESVGVRSGSGSALRTLIFLLPPLACSSSALKAKVDVFEALVAIINCTFQQTSPLVVDAPTAGTA
ncbi:hypothetical protein TcWFU_006181 [Taenia crassiceps]|uniref:Uncharacterized protein n=1 Tax=Taenia crassiceps TaxID=6207 RepID=A0ABR4QE79_9CEST